MANLLKARLTTKNLRRRILEAHIYLFIYLCLFMGAYILPAEPWHLAQEINFWYSSTIEYKFVNGIGMKKGVSS